MIVTEIDTGRSQYLLVFVILNSQDSRGVVSWIRRHAGRLIEDNDLTPLADACEKKYGERPHVVRPEEVHVIKTDSSFEVAQTSVSKAVSYG